MTNAGNIVMDCPETTCVKSNIYCIPNEVGDGICQDYNNGPYCDYDLGDCCLGNKTESCCYCYCDFLMLEGPAVVPVSVG